LVLLGFLNSWILGFISFKPSQAGEIPELLTSSSGDLNFRTGMQLYPQPATEPGSYALDPAKIDDLPPVSSEKDPGIQSNLKRVQRARHESTLAFKIDSRVAILLLKCAHQSPDKF
jgi:hypothetical protein